MKRVGIVIIVFALCMVLPIHAESFSLDEILEDIYNQLSEDGEVPMEDIQEELMEIAENPIDLNHTTADELSRLYFLSDEQIDAILLYQYKHPFNDIYELQLIDCLKDYEIRNLLPFVEVEAKGERLEVKGKNLYFREVFHYAKHEITLRTDARNIEDYEGDPMYGKLRYRFNYQNRVMAGVTIGRTQGETWENIDYGGFVELRDMGPMKRVVAGNYQASFGYGLVVG
ncbi:MAG: helix-hairpin-helix domain-containing protein, partial [Paludibacteraceae bacterium]|nr:helix-hairpin-helix domain-containing protein [Paludibacteraceae bacterium]